MLRGSGEEWKEPGKLNNANVFTKTCSLKQISLALHRRPGPSAQTESDSIAPYSLIKGLRSCLTDQGLQIKGNRFSILLWLTKYPKSLLRSTSVAASEGRGATCNHFGWLLSWLPKATVCSWLGHGLAMGRAWLGHSWAMGLPWSGHGCLALVWPCLATALSRHGHGMAMP